MLDITTLIFLVLAVVVFLKLRSVLGTREGHEQNPFDSYRRQDDSRLANGADQDKVVALPRRSGQSDAPLAPTDDLVTERLAGTVEAGSALDGALRRLMRADPNFDPSGFVNGAKAAYEMIVVAFAEGDRNTLKQLLSKDVHEGFMAAIADRESRSETVDFSFVGIDKAEITEADLRDNQAQVTVRFASQLISATRDSEGRIVDGDPNRVADVTDIWTFGRDVRSPDPNWHLVATEASD